MKNLDIFKTATILCIFLIGVTGKAQSHILDMATQDIPKNDLSSGQCYLKDVTHKLDNFLGTWEYTNGNEKFRIILTKTTKFHVQYPDIGLDLYQDGIDIQYQLLTNNQVTYTSPLVIHGTFRTTDGLILRGSLNDYGRITQTKHFAVTNQIAWQGGTPYRLGCIIEKIMVNLAQNEPEKISFKLYSKDTTGYSSAYQGMPTFSIPDDVVMVKVN